MARYVTKLDCQNYETRLPRGNLAIYLSTRQQSSFYVRIRPYLYVGQRFYTYCQSDSSLISRTWNRGDGMATIQFEFEFNRAPLISSQRTRLQHQSSY